jgi:alkylation response protein AidB-like acyl-CoA dehydrogenase
MIVGKKDFGPLPFMVPIRSRVDHKAYDGVSVGDIGTKLGYNSVDNGYLKFDQYRVPRESLLQRFVTLTREGEFELLGDPRAIY